MLYIKSIGCGNYGFSEDFKKVFQTINLWELYVAQGNQSSNPISQETLCSISPTLFALHENDHIWLTDLRDILL